MSNSNECFLIITSHHTSAEGCDFATMLARMYQRWLEPKEYALKVVDALPGETVGHKHVIFLVSGIGCIDVLQADSGRHRLCRISPFDASARRHTSFVDVQVLPRSTARNLAPESVKIERRGEPWNNYHFVKVTHIPSGVTASCTGNKTEKNIQIAIDLLEAKLESINKVCEVEHVLRSYTLQPYQLVKDYRTEKETKDVQAVLDGHLELLQKS